ncbi:hypothetical protein ACYCSE_19655 [Paenibacillus sp. SEL1]
MRNVSFKTVMEGYDARSHGENGR